MSRPQSPRSKKIKAVTDGAYSVDNLVMNFGRWLTQEDDFSDVIISSRIRLARNLQGLAFPNRFQQKQALQIRKEVKEACQQCPSLANARYYEIDRLSEWDRRYFVERRLASPQLIESGSQAMLVIAANEGLSIMVNEEDHLRLQCIEPGLGMTQAWKNISRLDDELQERLAFSYSKRFGYLTACPTNLGTGLRVSVFVHLPGLCMSENAQEALKALASSEIAVRGFYGEGSEAVGNIYQISNQLTLGRTEESVLELMGQVSDRIVRLEREARQRAYEKERVRVEDKVHRALGQLKSARIMTSFEAMDHLSNLRLGCELGLVRNLSRLAINQLMVLVQPAHLQKIFDQNLDAEQRDIFRADFLRETLENAN